MDQRLALLLAAIALTFLTAIAILVKTPDLGLLPLAALFVLLALTAYTFLKPPKAVVPAG